MNRHLNLSHMESHAPEIYDPSHLFPWLVVKHAALYRIVAHNIYNIHI